MTLWLTLTEQAPRKARRHRRPAFRPRLEVLEDRALPSAYSAANVSALIADITTANTAGGANTITLTPTPSPYVLTAINNTTTGANGLPVIAANDNLTIVGNGDTIERSARAFFRLFDVASGGSLTLENLTLQGGRVGGVGGSAGPNPAGPSNNAIYVAEGGAIYNQGTLVLSGVTVQRNVAEGAAFYGTTAGGGGIFSYGGSVTLEGGTIVRNNAAYGVPGPYGGNAYGGGLCAVGGTVTVTNATLDNNTASAGLGTNELESFGGVAYGGGVYVSGSTVNLTNATLNGNKALSSVGAAYGGGLFLFGGTTTMTNSIVQGNSASAGFDGPGTGQGGGIYIYAGAYYIGWYSGYVNTYVYLDTTTVAQVTGNTASDGAAYDNIVGSYTLK